MQKPTERQKENVLKTFTLIGFIVVVVICLWIAIQFVQAIPSVFSSLGAAITATNQVQEELVVSVPDTLVDTEKETLLSWTTTDNILGTYNITYTCTEANVALTLLDEEITLDCDTTHTLASGATGNVAIALSSNDRRFVDIPITLTFIPQDNIFETQEKTLVLTVFNRDISLSDSVGIDLGEEEEEQKETDTEANPSTPQPKPKPTFTTIIPVSDPNGFADLSASFLSVGFMRDGKFVPTRELDAGNRGAIRFAVQNLGTKTSDDWTFVAKLPTNRSNTFESRPQQGLAPQERSIITLEFDVANDTGEHEISALIEIDDDTVRINDDFFVSVRVD